MMAQVSNASPPDKDEAGQPEKAGHGHMEEPYRLLVDHSLQGLCIVTLAGRIVFANQALAQMFGYTPQELTALSPQQAGQLLRPEEQAVIEQRRSQRTGQPPPARYELRVPHRDGSLRWTEQYISPLNYEGEPALQIVVMDITERKQAEAQVRQLSRAVEQSPSVVAITDTHGTLEYVNPKFSQLTGYAPEEVIGQNPRLLKSGLQPPAFYQCLWDTLAAGHVWQGEFINRKKSGELYWEMASISPITNEQGVVTHFVKVAEDITARVQVEEALRQRMAQLEAVRQLGLAVVAELDLETLLHSITNRLGELLEGAHGEFRLYHPDEDSLEYIGPESRQPFLKRGEGLAGHILQTGCPFSVDDYAHWEGRAAAYATYSVKTAAGVPVRWGPPDERGQLLGVLNAWRDVERPFTQADIELLEMFAAYAAIAIHNARLLDQVRQDAAARADLLHEVNHRVKNNLTAIIGLLYAEQQHVHQLAQPGQPYDPHQAAYEAVLEDLTNRVHSLSEVHRLLSATDWLPLPLDELIWQIVQSSLQALPGDKVVALDVRWPWLPNAPQAVRVGSDQAHNLALVINELTTNTMKYAIGDRDSAHITVSVNLVANGTNAGDEQAAEANRASGNNGSVVSLEFCDDGPGYPPAVLEWKQYNVGLGLVRTILCQNLKGEVVLSNNGGAVTRLYFKVQPTATSARRAYRKSHE